MNEKCYVTDDLFNRIEGMSKAQILALFENASYTPSYFAGSLENGVSYLYTGIKPTDALLEAILNHGLETHTLTDVELDAINANVFSVLFFDIKTIAAKSDGTALYLNVVGESVSTLSSSSRVIKNYTTANYVDEKINEIKNGEIAEIEERLNNLGFKEGFFDVKVYDLTDKLLEEAVNITTNSIKKQGKYVIANLFVSNINGFIIRLSVPDEFKPKKETRFVVQSNTIFQGNETKGTSVLTLFKDGTTTDFSFAWNNASIEIINIGWEVE